jgi:hypothetical protein
MITITPLGGSGVLSGFREDAIGTLAFVLGHDKATSFVTSMEGYIRAQARAGAEQAIPTIRSEVREEAAATIRPYVIAALGLGVLAAGMSGYTFWKMRRR